MYVPELDLFLELSLQYAMVPLSIEVIADTETPISIFKKVAARGPSFLLESVEGGRRWARYSYIGLNPSSFFVSRGMDVTFVRDGKMQAASAHPIDALREFIGKQRMPRVGDPSAFIGGAVGYIGYDFVRTLESLPEYLPDDLGLPDIFLMVPDEMIVFDHLKQSISVIAYPRPGSGKAEAERAYHGSRRRLERILNSLRKPLSASRVSQEGQRFRPRFSSDLSKEEFKKRVKKIKDAIHQGEAIQVVFSQRMESAFSGDPFDLYRHLRQINPSPYLFYLNLPYCVLLGASPELLVRVHEGLIELRPIAGTRPRGGNADEEQRLEAELLNDEKERAEHVMLVDLGRNDIGRVSEPGTVKVMELMGLEKYSHVIHLVSGIRGTLARDKDCLDLLQACFPAGTVSGAPKVRAMEIIEETETRRRGPYAGAVGYFSFTGDMELCITIRSILIHRGKAYIQAGAGIVADSQPEREYLETIHKAEAMIRAIESAGKGG